MKNTAADVEVSAGSQVAHIVDEITERLNRGDRIDIDAYAERYPHIGETIRRVFDTLVAIRDGGTNPLRAAGVSADKPEAMGQLGDFQIIREIGCGGMGVVYEAEQISLRRRVALKVLPFAAVLDKKHIQRFQNEAQAAAALDHPNIVRVHSVGCDRGVHYYAMQYIEGRTLAQVIDELRQLSSSAPQEEQDPSAPPSRLAVDLTSGRLAPSHKQPRSDDPTTDLSGETAALDPPPDDTDRPPQAHVSTDVSTRNPAFFRSVARLGIQAAEALEHAHQMGVVHRDIKPSNLMVDSSGHLWITDFGLAMTQTDANLTMTGDILGTLRYMSPEQISGKHRVMDQHTDTYSLGVTLYELLALRPAFAGDDRQKLIEQISMDEPPTVRRINSAIPRDLETIVLKATAKEPQARYATAQALADDLQRFLQDKPIEAKRSSLAARLRKWSRRHQPVVWSAVATLILGFVAFAASTVLIASAYEREKQQGAKTQTALQLAEQQERLAKKQQRLADEQRELAEEQKKEAIKQQAEIARQRDAIYQNHYVARMRLAQQDWESGRIAGLRDVLDQYLPQPGRADVRGWEWYYLLSLCYRDLMTLRRHPGGINSVAWSPDGLRLASGDWFGNIIIWNPDSGKKVRTLHGPSISVLAWSPDSRRLGAARQSTIRIWDPESGRMQLGISTGVPRVESIAWSPDGKKLASPGADKTVAIWDATTGKKVRTLAGHDTKLLNVAWSPDGRRLAASGTEPNTITIWDAESGEIQATLKGPSFILHLAWNPESTRLLSGDHGGRVRVWDPVGRRELFSMSHGGPVVEAAWSPDGEKIVARIRGHSVVVWDAATGEKLLGLRGHIGVIRSVDWSPDGKRLATGGHDGVAKIWDARQQQDSVSLGQDAKRGVSWSPDDRLLAWISNHQTIKICDAHTGKQIHALRQPEWSEIEVISWSPNGKHLASSSADAAIVVWDTITGKEILSWTHEGVRAPVALDAHRCVNIAWHPDGQRLASVSEKEKTVRIWDVSTGKQVSSFDADFGRGHPHHWSVAWSPDGERLATGSREGVEIRETVGWRKLHGIRAGVEACLAWSPDGRCLSTGRWSTGKVWDTSTGREILSLEGLAMPIFSLTWSRDGRRIAAASLNETRLCDATTGQQLFILNGGCPAWSHDNKRVATIAADDTVKVYDASIGYDNARYLYGVMYLDTAAPDKPIADVSKAVDYVLDRVRRMAKSDRVEEAIALMQRLVTRFPDVTEYRQELARIHFDRGDGPFHHRIYSKAFPCFEQAIRVNPKYSEAYDHRGRVYLARNELDKAITDFDAAIQFGPAYGTSTYTNRGAAHLLKGSFDDGFADFSKAIGLEPESAILQYNRALARLVSGDVHGYRGECASMLKHFGQTEDVNAAHWAAWTCALAPDAVADYSTAVALAKKAIDIDPESISYLNTLGAILNRAGRLEEATDRLVEADGLMETPDPIVQDLPPYAWQSSPQYTWFFLAMARHGLGHGEEGKKWLDKAVASTDKVVAKRDDGTERAVLWNHRLTLELFREEAEALLKTSGPSRQPETVPTEKQGKE